MLKGNQELSNEELEILEPLLTQAVQEANFELPPPVWFHKLVNLQERVQLLVIANRNRTSK